MRHLKKLLVVGMLVGSTPGWITAALAEPAPQSSGVERIQSPYDAQETLRRVENTIRSRGLTVFPRIDHAEAAKAVGLSMPPTWVVVFGKPSGGTPAMIANPTSAIDFPLKALVYQDAAGSVWIAYNSEDYMSGIFVRHGRPADASGYAKAISGIVAEAIR